MNASDPTEHLLLFRNTAWSDELSPQQLQQAMDETMVWFERLHEAGLVKGAQPLENTGRVVSGPDGSAMTDGPFAESKEAIGGYLIVSIVDFDEAVALARTFPMLTHGAQVEVRPIAAECPVQRRLRESEASVEPAHVPA